MDTPSTSRALDNDWSVLLAACSVVTAEEKLSRLRSLLQLPVRWKSLLALADQHGTQPLLYQALSRIVETVPAAVPVDEMRLLERQYQTNLRKSLLLSRELIRILDHLSGRKIEALPYKGVALAEMIYGDIALRPSSDIDLLIRRQDFLRVREAVRDLGFTQHTHLSEAQEHIYLKSGYEYSFDAALGPNLLEIQWAIQPRFYAIDFDMDALFERAMTVSVAGQSLKTLSAEDLVLVLSAHAAKHVWGRLIWLCDLARIFMLPNLNWSWIASQARDLGIVRILSVTMIAANRLLGTIIPAAALEAGMAGDNRETSTLYDQVQTHMVSETTYNIESFAYFRLMMRLREKRGDRLCFLQRLIFTPGPGEWDAVRLPRPLFPLYRLVRLSRLTARLLRS
jgi:Uncharacterised nucleotidyltransferase